MVAGSMRASGSRSRYASIRCRPRFSSAQRLVNQAGRGAPQRRFQAGETDQRAVLAARVLSIGREAGVSSCRIAFTFGVESRHLVQCAHRIVLELPRIVFPAHREARHLHGALLTDVSVLGPVHGHGFHEAVDAPSRQDPAPCRLRDRSNAEPRCLCARRIGWIVSRASRSPMPRSRSRGRSPLARRFPRPLKRRRRSGCWRRVCAGRERYRPCGGPDQGFLNISTCCWGR